MIKPISSISIVAASIIAVKISSCNKNDTDKMTHDTKHPMLNINYPTVYIVKSTSNNMSVIKLSNNAVTEPISLSGAKYPSHINIIPSKTKLAVSIMAGDLSGRHALHGGATARNQTAGAHTIAFSQDGRTVSITNQTANAVSVLDVVNHIC